MIGISSGPVSPAEALACADEVEAAIMEIMNGKRKPGKMPLEPMVRLAQFARDAQASLARYDYIRSNARGRVDGRGRQEFDLPDPYPLSDIMRGSVAQHLDAAIDAALVAAKGDSGQDGGGAV